MGSQYILVANILNGGKKIEDSFTFNLIAHDLETLTFKAGTTKRNIISQHTIVVSNK